MLKISSKTEADNIKFCNEKGSDNWFALSKWLKEHGFPFSEKTSLSIGTLNRWCRLYKDSNGDLKSLRPKNRCDQGKSRAMDEDICLSLIESKLQTPALTVPQLIEHGTKRTDWIPSLTVHRLSSTELPRRMMNNVFKTKTSTCILRNGDRLGKKSRKLR